MKTRINKSYSWRPSKRLISRFMAGEKRAVARFTSLIRWIEDNTSTQCCPQTVRNTDHMDEILTRIEEKEFFGLLPAQRQELLEDFFYAVRSADELERCASCRRLYDTCGELHRECQYSDWYCFECKPVADCDDRSYDEDSVDYGAL